MKALNSELLFAPRILVWFSCGAASAVAAKRTVEKYGDTHDVEVIYCDTLKYEHPDNLRFLSDVSAWIGVEIKIMKSQKYTDIMDCFRKKQFIVSPHGAPCTEMMKKQVRLDYASGLDIHVFGFTVEEQRRIDRTEKENPQLWCEWILQDKKITKKDCYRIIQEAGIELPAMYRLGYKNNNCIGCVKGGMGYWNKIRVDFPERFQEMAVLEREIGASILTDESGKVFLDELASDRGQKYEEDDIECGVLCKAAEAF